MASLLNVGFSIDRSSFPAGSICSINYQYALQCDHYEIEKGLGFNIWCEVWGKELTGERIIGDVYDDHTLIAATILHRTRSFIIPCSLLDDRLGEDRIFLIITARASNGLEYKARSPMINEHF